MTDSRANHLDILAQVTSDTHQVNMSDAKLLRVNFLLVIWQRLWAAPSALREGTLAHSVANAAACWLKGMVQH